MKATFTDSGLKCPRRSLDIVRTLTCGQVFRYFEGSDGVYTVRSGDRICKLYYDGDSTVLETDSPEYFYGYFDFDTDYDGICKGLGQFGELKDALTVSEGLRILRQDPFETAIGFIISANNNISRIRGIIERLCSRFGVDGAFPTREKLLAVTAEQYREIGCGFRSEYLYETVPKLTREFLEELKNLPAAEAQKKLCSLKGVGAKVADCILLFAYARTDRFPVDTWIFKTCGNESLRTPAEVAAYYESRYGDSAGYAQQYIFEYSRKAASKVRSEKKSGSGTRS